MNYITLEDIKVWCILLQTIALVVFVVCFVTIGRKNGSQKNHHYFYSRTAAPKPEGSRFWFGWDPHQEVVSSSWQAADPEQGWSTETNREAEEEENQVNSDCQC